MTELLFASSTCVANMDVSVERVDLTSWLFSLRDDEYRACSKAHIAAGASRAPDGRRMSINVENPGGTLLVQHYVEEISTRRDCRVSSDTDAFTPFGRSRYRVVWQLDVEASGPLSCVFSNHVEVYATDELVRLLSEHQVPLAQAAALAQRTVDEHNAEETPLFAKNIAAKARDGFWRP